MEGRRIYSRVDCKDIIPRESHSSGCAIFASNTWQKVDLGNCIKYVIAVPSLQFLTDIGILLKKDCKMKHPPGKKVYQRGAHIIWEVDGAREKVSSNLLTVEMTSSKCTSSFTAKIYHSSENYSSMSRLYFLIVTIVRNPPLLYFRLPLSRIFDSSILHPHRRQIIRRPHFRVLLQGPSNTFFIGRVLRRNVRKNYPMTTTTLPAL